MPAGYDVITNQIIYIETHNIKKQQIYEQVLRFFDHVQIDYILLVRSRALLSATCRFTWFIAACKFDLFLNIVDIKTTSIMLTAFILEF